MSERRGWARLAGGTALGSLLLAGCWPDIRGKNYEAWDEEGAEQAPKIVNEPGPDGVTATTVDSTDANAWLYVDLDEDMLEVSEGDQGWDLGFSRQRVKLNGGVSGEAGVEVAIVEADSLKEVTEPPATGFVTDLVDDDDENAEPEYAFDAWFDYDSTSHVLTPKPLVFVVRTTEEQYVAIEILSYYDEAGSSGLFSLEWKYL